MSEHELKCWPEFFAAILSGEKTFELRKDDRQPPFRVGDTLWLREWRRSTQTYTGRELCVTVTYVLAGFGLEHGYAAMGFESSTVADLRAEVTRLTATLAEAQRVKDALRLEAQEWRDQVLEARRENTTLRASVESAAVGLGQSRVDRIAELEEREKTLLAFSNAALEHQREAEARVTALEKTECHVCGHVICHECHEHTKRALAGEGGGK
jgi:hypothetical protein